MLRVIKLGSSGSWVYQWQAFLRGQGFTIFLNGLFDEKTQTATAEFQRNNNLAIDGVVGNQTYGKAAILGFVIASLDESDKDYPKPPTFFPLVSTSDRQKELGLLTFIPAPTPENCEAIKITNDWEKENIVSVSIPQLKGIEGCSNGTIEFHKKAVSQLENLWEAWDAEGLLSLVKTFDGSFFPRFIRGKADRQILSNHAFGTAFDINAQWNEFGAQPAALDEDGCVYKLVPIANKFGFYWGGHFSVTRDGMHFEFADF